MKKTKGKIPKKTRCKRCGENLNAEFYRTNEKLLNGQTPWCLECLEQLEKGKDQEEQKRYNQDYQKSYHRQRVELSSASESKRKTKRGAERFSRSVVKQRLPRFLTLAAIRRPEVASELQILIPEMRKTKVWQEFEDDFIAKVCEKHEVNEAEVTEVKRFLPVESYPELALLEENCFVDSSLKQRLTYGADSISAIDYKLGMSRLATCICEVL